MTLSRIEQFGSQEIIVTKRNLFVLVFILASCGDTEKRSNQDAPIIRYKPDSTAFKLNNKAARLIGKAAHSYDSLKVQLYDSAIFYLDQALKLDSVYLLAYTNKAQALQRMGSLEEALQVLKEVEVIKPDFPEAITGQGFLFEKMGKMAILKTNHLVQLFPQMLVQMLHRGQRAEILGPKIFPVFRLSSKRV